jgi:asparagine synthase (glutamine-hydrolysing)
MTGALTAPGLNPSCVSWNGPADGDQNVLLACLDFSREDRPSAPQTRSSGAVLVGDVRLYDRPLLSAEDQAEGKAPQALVAAALDRYGRKALEGLRGDFAFADWNTRKRELLLARDAMGVRPLVFHFVPGRFVAFASFPRALHASGLLGRQLDAGAVIRHMLGVSRRAETLFSGVEPVIPGTSLSFSSSSRSLISYWQPVATYSFASPQAGAAALGEAVQEAVRQCVAGSGPVAAHLSGGLDSSAVAVLAARAILPAGRRLLACSFLDRRDDESPLTGERPYVEAVLRREPGMEWMAIAPGSSTLPAPNADRILPESLDSAEDAVCAHAARQGAEIILSGWGGDEAATFNGRGALAEAFLTLRWRYLARELRAMRTQRGFSIVSTLRGELLTYLVPGLMGLLRHRRAGSVSLDDFTSSLVRPEQRRLALAEAGKPLRMGWSARRNQQLLIGSSHLERRMGDWAELGARHGIAFSFPLLDRTVIGCALSMETGWHLRGGWKRRVFRDAMEGILPEEIRWRHGKLAAFPAALEDLAAQRDTMRERLGLIFARPSVHSVLDAAKLAQVLARFPSAGELRNDPARQRDLLILAHAAPYAQLLAREAHDLPRHELSSQELPSQELSPRELSPRELPATDPVAAPARVRAIALKPGEGFATSLSNCG